jgi:hypothetical protein
MEEPTMTKLIANVLKKVPVPGVEFSNQQFSGGLEVELPGDAADEIVQRRLQELYALLSRTVEAEIAAASEVAVSGTNVPTEDGRRDYAPSDRDARRDWTGRNARDGGERRDWRDSRQGYRRESGGEEGGERYRRDGGQRQSGGSWRQGGGNRNGQATQAQVKAVFGIAKGRGIERRDLLERIEEQFNVRRVEELNVRQASELIESLKAA